MGNGTKTVAHGFPNRCPSVFGRLPMVLPNIAHNFTRLCPDDPYQDVARNVSTDNGKQKTISPQKGSLATVIRGFKSAITKYARARGITFAWQTRFHDRIVRNQNELNAIVEYIENNPYK